MPPPPYAAALNPAGLLDPSAYPRGDPAPLGIRALLAALAPYAATSRISVLAAESSAAAAAAAASRPLGSFVGDLLRDAAPRIPLLATKLVLDSAAATKLVLDSAAASQFGKSASTALSAPYAARMGMVSRVLKSTASPHRPFFLFTRSASTNTGPNQVRRQLNGSRQLIWRQAMRVRQETGVLKSLDIIHQEMGYITRGPFGRFFVFFTMFTIMSKGVREFGQLLVGLRSLRDKGVVEDELVSIMTEEFGWLFE